MTATSNTAKPFSPTRNFVKHFIPTNVVPDLPGDILQVGTEQRPVNIHRQMIFGSMDDYQVELALVLLRSPKLHPDVLSVFLLNMLGITTNKSWRCTYPISTLVDAHYLTIQIASLFVGKKLFFWWLFYASGLADCARTMPLSERLLAWPDQIISTTNHASIDASYLYMIQAVCSKMEPTELALNCPWSHLSLLSKLVELPTLAPCYRFYCQRVINPRCGLSDADVAESLLIPKPDFCIAVEAKDGKEEYSITVHSWVMYAMWPYFRRALDYSKGTLDRKIILPRLHFSKETLRELVALSYDYDCGGVSEFSFWRTADSEVLTEYELFGYASRYGRKQQPHPYHGRPTKIFFPCD